MALNRATFPSVNFTSVHPQPPSTPQPSPAMAPVPEDPPQPDTPSPHYHLRKRQASTPAPSSVSSRVLGAAKALTGESVAFPDNNYNMLIFKECQLDDGPIRVGDGIVFEAGQWLILCFIRMTVRCNVYPVHRACSCQKGSTMCACSKACQTLNPPDQSFSRFTLFTSTRFSCPTPVLRPSITTFTHFSKTQDPGACPASAKGQSHTLSSRKNPREWDVVRLLGYLT